MRFSAKFKYSIKCTELCYFRVCASQIVADKFLLIKFIHNSHPPLRPKKMQTFSMQMILNVAHNYQ